MSLTVLVDRRIVIVGAVPASPKAQAAVAGEKPESSASPALDEARLRNGQWLNARHQRGHHRLGAFRGPRASFLRRK